MVCAFTGVVSKAPINVDVSETGLFPLGIGRVLIEVEAAVAAVLLVLLLCALFLWLCVVACGATGQCFSALIAPHVHGDMG